AAFAKTQQRRNAREGIRSVAVKLGQRQLGPASVAPMLIPMRPDPSPDPAVKAMEESANVGTFLILAATPQEWIKFRDQLLGSQRYRPLGALQTHFHDLM